MTSDFDTPPDISAIPEQDRARFIQHFIASRAEAVRRNDRRWRVMGMLAIIGAGTVIALYIWLIMHLIP